MKRDESVYTEVKKILADFCNCPAKIRLKPTSLTAEGAETAEIFRERSADSAVNLALFVRNLDLQGLQQNDKKAL